ncbi:MAG: V-type ATPase subunit [Hydrogenoanaerobacterium sp.]
MLDSFSGNAIMAKAKAMYGRRLTDVQYKDLIHKKTVAELAEYLRSETAYADALSMVQPTAVHRGQLENILQKEYFRRYKRLIDFDFSPGSYYRYLVRELEIKQILQMIRLLNSGRADEYITQYPEFLEKYSSFSLMKLARVRSFDELLNMLEGSPYAGLIMKLRPVGDELIDYTACEMALMGYFYTRVEQTIDRNFGGKTKKELHEIFDTVIELKNITSIYRLKRYFPNASSQYIKSCLLPHWKRIPEHFLDELINAADSDEFARALTASPYAKFLGMADYVFIEYSGSCIRYNLNKRYLRFTTSTPTVFTAYMALSEIEYSNLTCIIEGIRYQIPASEIEKLLVL